MRTTTKKAAPHTTTHDQEQLPPDPESFTDVAGGNFVFRLAVGLIILLAVLGLVIALAK